MLSVLQNIPSYSPTPHHERFEPDRFTIEYKEKTNSFILKGEFDSAKSYESLKDVKEQINQHMSTHTDLNLYLYIKTADLRAINLLNQISSQSKNFTGNIHFTWFVSDTRPHQYALADEITKRYSLNSTMVDVI